MTNFDLDKIGAEAARLWAESENRGSNRWGDA